VPTDELERARDRWTASSRGDMEPMLERFAADCELHSRVAELEGEGGVFHGHEGLRAFARELRETLGQVAFDLREMRRRGGLTLMIGRTTGRGSGSGVDIDVPIVWLRRKTTPEESSGHRRSATSTRPLRRPCGERQANRAPHGAG
jgi:ketosteroid isomerase-like protein